MKRSISTSYRMCVDFYYQSHAYLDNLNVLEYIRTLITWILTEWCMI